jgi:hypothetical protein
LKGRAAMRVRRRAAMRHELAHLIAAAPQVSFGTKISNQRQIFMTA